jgi:hypothetical protein
MGRSPAGGGTGPAAAPDPPNTHTWVIGAVRSRPEQPGRVRCGPLAAGPGAHDGRQELDAVLADDLGPQAVLEGVDADLSADTAPARSRNGSRLRTVAATYA